MGEGTLGSPRDPMGGGPGPPMGGEPLEAQGIPWEGTLGAPRGCFLLLFEVAFLEDPSETKIQNHSHEIRLEKLVCMLFPPCHFAITRYQNIEKTVEKDKRCTKTLRGLSADSPRPSADLTT